MHSDPLEVPEHPWYPQRQRRHVRQDEKDHDLDEQKGNDGAKQFLDGDVSDRAQDEEIRSNWGGDLSDEEIDRHDDAEMQGMHP